MQASSPATAVPAVTAGTVVAMLRRSFARRPPAIPPLHVANEARHPEGWEPARLQAPLSTMARLAADGVGVGSCRFLLTTDDHTFIVAGDYGRDGLARDRGSADAQDDWVAREVLRTGRRMVIADLDATNLVPPAAAETYRRRGHRAILALPMISAGRIAGVMELAEGGGARSFTGAERRVRRIRCAPSRRPCCGRRRRSAAASGPGA